MDIYINQSINIFIKHHKNITKTEEKQHDKIHSQNTNRINLNKTINTAAEH